MGILKLKTQNFFYYISYSTTKKCSVVDAREVAPSAATENMFKERWNASRYGKLVFVFLNPIF